MKIWRNLILLLSLLVSACSLLAPGGSDRRALERLQEAFYAAVEDGEDPMLDGWFTDETGVATRAVLASLNR